MSFLKLAFCIAAIALVPVAANACRREPPTLPLPGESNAAHEARSAVALRARSDEDRRNFQSTLFDTADAISLALVRVSDSGYGLDVEPVEALKGQRFWAHRRAGMPTGRLVRLVDRPHFGCDIAADVSAIGAKPGEYILLFHDAVWFGEKLVFYGLSMTELREPRLMQAVRDAEIKLRNEHRSVEAQ